MDRWMRLILRSTDALKIALQVGAPLLEAQKVGISTRQDRVSTVHRNPIHIQSPTPCHGSSTPPYIKVGVHSNKPSNIPMV